MPVSFVEDIRRLNPIFDTAGKWALGYAKVCNLAKASSQLAAHVYKDTEKTSYIFQQNVFIEAASKLGVGLVWCYNVWQDIVYWIDPFVINRIDEDYLNGCFQVHLTNRGLSEEQVKNKTNALIQALLKDTCSEQELEKLLKKEDGSYYLSPILFKSFLKDLPDMDLKKKKRSVLERVARVCHSSGLIMTAVSFLNEKKIISQGKIAAELGTGLMAISGLYKVSQQDCGKGQIRCILTRFQQVCNISVLILEFKKCLEKASLLDCAQIAANLGTENKFFIFIFETGLNCVINPIRCVGLSLGIVNAILKIQEINANEDNTEKRAQLRNKELFVIFANTVTLTSTLISTLVINANPTIDLSLQVISKTIALSQFIYTNVMISSSSEHVMLRETFF